MKIAIGSDHAGFEYKARLIEWLRGPAGGQHDVTDLGTYAAAPPVDYPLFIRPVAESVARGEVERGIVLGGSGNGEALVANRVRGVRCGLCWSEQLAIWSRAHNDANCLSIGQRTVTLDEAIGIVRTWLTTDFEGGRHIARLRKRDGV